MEASCKLEETRSVHRLSSAPEHVFLLRAKSSQLGGNSSSECPDLLRVFTTHECLLYNPGPVFRNVEQISSS